MDPVKVKVYGLFPLTRQRYLVQALIGVVGAALLLVGWYFALHPMCVFLSRPGLPPSAYRTAIVAVLDNVPWIVIAALACKGVEMWIVLRIFARKEAAVSPQRKQGP